MVEAGAASLQWHVTDSTGKALMDAVVTLAPETGDSAGPRSPPRDHVIDQREETFVPLVEVVPLGDGVIFHNSDRTRHHVYSFSPLGPFEFLLNPQEQSAPIHPRKAGVMAVGCNIHDFMIHYLFVTDSRWAVKSDHEGTALMSDVPAGSYVVQIWHPRLRPGSAPPTQTVAVSGDSSSVTVAIPVLPERRTDSEHERY